MKENEGGKLFALFELPRPYDSQARRHPCRRMNMKDAFDRLQLAEKLAAAQIVIAAYAGEIGSRFGARLQHLHDALCGGMGRIWRTRNEAEGAA